MTDESAGHIQPTVYLNPQLNVKMVLYDDYLSLKARLLKFVNCESCRSHEIGLHSERIRR